jgi:MGT family glycosyltransferase
VDVDISLDYGLTLLAALLIGTGFVFQQNAAAREPDSRFLSLRLMTDLLREPRWLGGIACMIGGQILAAWSIGHLELSFVEPLLTTNLIFALLLAMPLSKASVRFWEVVGAAVLCTGVALLSASRSAKPIGLSFGSFSHWPAAAVIAGIAFVAVQAGRRRRHRAKAMLTGLGAGLVYGIQDALTRQTLEILQSSGIGALFVTWAPYALVGAGATGIWLMQNAFSAGPLQVSLPAIAAGEPLVGILLGIIIFGDRIQISTGMLALQAGGIAALVLGVIAVARAPALSALRGITPPGLPHGLPHVPGRHPPSPNGNAPAPQAAQPVRDEKGGEGTTQEPQRDMRGLRHPSRSVPRAEETLTGRTILFMPESAYGPTNNCVGIGDVLRRRGHRVVFAAEASWRGKLSALGFEEDLVDLAPATGEEQDAGQYWKDFVRDTAPEFRKPTIEQLETVIKPIWDGLIDGAKYCEPRLRQIIERVKPDVIVEDNVIGFPALTTAGVPFVRIVSCNPLEVKGPKIPPVFSGYPSGDSSQWSAYLAEYDRVHRGIWSDFNDWVVEQGARPLADLEFIHEGDLNLYVYPEAADYVKQRPLGPTWHRLDSSVRETDEPFEIPASLTDRPGSLVYLSLGSLGSADVELMRRLTGMLADTPHRYIVSKGPLHAEFGLPPNMWGAEFVPQASVLPFVDLVITHAGNNTTTESLHFGKPMICLPLFWDQYDNAQRIDELGLGARLDPYRVTADELRSAVDGLLGRTALRAKLAVIAMQVRARDGVRRAADLIEKAA